MRILIISSILYLSSCRTTDNSPSQVQAFSENSCEFKAQQAVTKNTLNLDQDLLASYIKLDCSESRKINRLDKPYQDAQEINSYFDYFFDLLPTGIIENWANITSPYCRQDHEWFGSFCMASDIHAANTILNRPDLIKELPHYIVLLSKLSDKDGQVSPFDEIETDISIDDHTLIMSFILLDDNGVQTSRLLSNLLFQNKFEIYGKLFPYFIDIYGMKLSDGNEPEGNLSKIFYATRTGKFTLKDLLGEEYKLTYKAFSGVYLGCQLKQKGHYKLTAKSLSSIAATTYEFVKLKDIFSLSNAERIEKLKYIWNKSKISRDMMEEGSSLGYQLCQNKT